MSISRDIATRYLVSKKKSRAINIISIIAIVGIAVGTSSAILVSSVFNGFEEVIMGMFDRFNPDLKVLPAQGKFFKENSLSIEEIENLPNVESVSRVLEEMAFFEYGDHRDMGRIKGVDDHFFSVIESDNLIKEGKFVSTVSGRDAALVSTELSRKFQIGYHNEFEPIHVYSRSKKTNSPMGKSMSRHTLVPTGRFDLSDEENRKMVLTRLEKVRTIFQLPTDLSALEIDCIEVPSLSDKNEIKKILGDQYVVMDRYEQQASFLKLMNIEKWVGLAILSLALLLVSFNMLGAMWMIVLEKEGDIALLKAVGLTDARAGHIFIWQGIALSFLGLILGVVIGLIIYILQKQYGIISLDPSMANQAYPVEFEIFDLLPISIIVIITGILASLPAAWRARTISSRMGSARL